MTDTEEIALKFRELGSEAVTELVVWTEAYNAFIMGGDVRRPIKAKVPVLGPFDLGKGYIGYLALHPESDSVHVAESETGAFVGSSLAEVRKDIQEAEESVMRDQIEAARKRADYAMLLPAAEFWGKFRPKKPTKQ